VGSPDAPYIALLRLDAGHPVSARHATLLVASLGAAATIDATALLTQAGGRFGHLAEMTPGRAPVDLVAGATLTLAPGEVRIFAGVAAAPRSRAEPDTAPTGEGRVLIEAVQPEIDGGATPIKRVVGEAIEVTADIFTDGHEKIAAEIMYRPADEAAWRSAPMRFVDNDRWTGSFPLERKSATSTPSRPGATPTPPGAPRSKEARRRPDRAPRDDRRRSHRQGRPGRRALTVRRSRRCSSGSRPRRRGAPVAARPAGGEATRSSSRPTPSASTSALSRDLRARHRRPLAARFSAWYELFPRSQSGDPNRHGTFEDVTGRLPFVRDLGFDVLYFTPIHPIGKVNRRARTTR
jgi:starch synthase (maltosyl-transferring)